MSKRVSNKELQECCSDWRDQVKNNLALDLRAARAELAFESEALRVSRELCDALRNDNVRLRDDADKE